MQSLDFLFAELCRELERGQPRGVEDLVGIGVPDAGKQARIGERSLECVGLARQGPPERGEVGREHVDAAGVVCGEARRAAREIERRAMLATCLGEEQGPGGKIERREPQPRGDRGTGWFPPQPARDHEMQDGEVVSVEAEDDSLPEPPEAPHRAAGELLGTGVDRSEQEWTRDAQPLQPLSHHARLQRLQVHHDVGELGHGVVPGERHRIAAGEPGHQAPAPSLRHGRLACRST